MNEDSELQTPDEVVIEPSAQLLDQNERRSTAWLKLEKHLKARLQRLREQNDQQHDLVATAKLRGQIHAVKDILALGASRAPSEVVDDAAE